MTDEEIIAPDEVPSVDPETDEYGTRFRISTDDLQNLFPADPPPLYG